LGLGQELVGLSLLGRWGLSRGFGPHVHVA
jgi:hypothetical protein